MVGPETTTVGGRLTKTAPLLDEPSTPVAAAASLLPPPPHALNSALTAKPAAASACMRCGDMGRARGGVVCFIYWPCKS